MPSSTEDKYYLPISVSFWDRDIDNRHPRWGATMWLKKYLPKRSELEKSRILNALGSIIFEPNLWHFNRHSVSHGVLIGSICCFLPIPLQMLPCAILCALRKCNIPVAIAIVWISNPLTMAPMMYFAYRLGAWLTGTGADLGTIEISFQWLGLRLAEIWQPLILGCLVCGLSMGLVGFITVRIYWRLKINRYQDSRKQRRNKPLT